MAINRPLAFNEEPADLPSNPAQRHEALVGFFGQFIFWLRKWALDASRKLIESDDARDKLGRIRRKPYDAVPEMPPAQRDAAMLLAEETLNGEEKGTQLFLVGIRNNEPRPLFFSF